jgi:hypothetical protein
MALNKEGIELLKADLRANAKLYDQNSYGHCDWECGTVACIAGTCLRRAIGTDAFTLAARVAGGNLDRNFVDNCLHAGAAQLGIVLAPIDGHFKIPHIFMPASSWPADLWRQYAQAHMAYDHLAMVETACTALDRMDEYGEIKEIENEVNEENFGADGSGGW